MAKLQVIIAAIGLILVMLGLAATSSMRLSAVETRTARSEADIKELQGIRTDLEKLNRTIERFRSEQCFYHTGKPCVVQPQ